MIIAVSVVTFLLTFPLNRMVGREFVPNEDMGEWTAHMDTPEGTSLEGTEELAFKRARRSCRASRASREIEPIVNPGGSGAAGGGGGGIATHFHFNFLAVPAEERKRIAERDHQRRCGSGWRSTRRTGRASRRATRSAAAKGRAASRSRPTSSAPT